MTIRKQSKIKILDQTLRHGFSQTPRIVLKATCLSMQAKILYTLLLDYAWQKGQCFPGQDRLAKDLGTHRNTIQKYLKELKDHKLIDWNRRGFRKTNIYYILPLENVLKNVSSDAQGTVHPDAQGRVQHDAQGLVHRIEEDEYKKKEYKQSLTLSNDNGNINLETFDSEAIALATELNDERSIKYYQKLINQKKRGEITKDDIQTALDNTRKMIRTDKVDGTQFLKNPAGWFVSVLQKLLVKRSEKQRQEKVKAMLGDFGKSFLDKSKI